MQTLAQAQERITALEDENTKLQNQCQKYWSLLEQVTARVWETRHEGLVDAIDRAIWPSAEQDVRE